MKREGFRDQPESPETAFSPVEGAFTANGDTSFSTGATHAPVYIVDAFTHRGGGGNKAGVVLLADGFLPDSVMQGLATKLGYSETVFVTGAPLREVRMRYFTPTDEVGFCGHATIAAFAVMEQAAGSEPGRSDEMRSGGARHADAVDVDASAPKRNYTVLTAAGAVQVEIGADGCIWMEMDAPRVLRVLTDGERKELLQIMGLGIDSAGRRSGCISSGTGSANDSSDEDRSAAAKRGDSVLLADRLHTERPAGALVPAIVNAGLTDILLPTRGRDELNALTPDFEALAEYSRRLGVVGVHAFAMEAGVIHARNFAPLYGIDEESATGTSNAGLTQYLYECGLVQANMRNTVLQGERMGCLSEILTKVCPEPAEMPETPAAESAVDTTAERPGSSGEKETHADPVKRSDRKSRLQIGGFGTIVDIVSC